MKRRRHTAEQIVRKLREADRLIAEGMQVPEVAKELEVSEQTYHRWRAQYGGMQADDVKRLKELERENAQLKRLVVDKELETLALREISKGRMKVKPSWWSSWRVVAVGAASRRRCAGRRSRQLRLSDARAGGVPRGWGL